jgi:hypothetical protein
LLDGNNRVLLDRQPSSAGSTFYIDSFNIVTPPLPRQTDSSVNMFSTSSLNHNNQSTFYYQPSPQFVPARPPPPVPVTTAASIINSSLQQPLISRNLSLNLKTKSHEEVTDLLDLGDPGSPPPSPKFDPYA